MKDKKQENLSRKPAFSDAGNIHAVIEVPAGTNIKYEYVPEKGIFSAFERPDKPRVVEFLPYPSNYGFIPSTFMELEKGGDGDPLDIIVLAESKPQGQLVEVLPLGMLQLIDNGKEDPKILSIPVKESEQILFARRLEDVPKAVLEILEIWFVNYKGKDKLQSKGWVGAVEAVKEIRKWLTT